MCSSCRRNLPRSYWFPGLGSALSTRLWLEIHLIDVHTVPFPCPMECPPVSKEHSERRLLELAQQSRLPGRAHVVYSRDQFEGFLGALQPKSLVLLATKKRWWPTRETKLARFLTQAGHEVMLLVVR